MKTSWRHWFGVLAIVAVSAAPQAEAAGIYFEGKYTADVLDGFPPPPNGNIDSVKVGALFQTVSSTQIQLTLSYINADIQSGKKFDNPAVLTGFIWAIENEILTFESTQVVLGSTTYLRHTADNSDFRDPGEDVSEFWGYLEAPPDSGVGAVGANTFTAIVGGSQSDLDGVDYGIVPDNVPFEGGGLGASDKILAKGDTGTDSSVIFTFTVADGTADDAILAITGQNIENMRFLFGSNATQFAATSRIIIPSNIGEVPEPGSIAAMLSLASIGVGAFVVRRRRAKASRR